MNKYTVYAWVGFGWITVTTTGRWKLVEYEYKTDMQVEVTGKEIKKKIYKRKGIFGRKELVDTLFNEKTMFVGEDYISIRKEPTETIFECERYNESN